MAGMRIPTLSRHIALAGAVLARWSATREIQVILGFSGAHPLEMARARIPALSRHVAVAGAVVAHQSAAREVQVVLGFAGAHSLEMARARIPALLGAIILRVGGCRCASQ